MTGVESQLLFFFLCVFYSFQIPVLLGKAATNLFLSFISFPSFSELDYLRNKKPVVAMTCDSVQSSSVPVPPTDPGDNGRYIDIKSSVTNDNHGEIEEKMLFTESKLESRASKEDYLISVLSKEREKLPPCSPSNKTTVHFDRPNRLVML